MTFERLPIDQLKPNPLNPKRKIPKAHIKKIAESIKYSGFNSPIVIDENDFILAGHSRHLAARYLGMKDLPCVRVSGLTEDQKRRFIVADNSLARKQFWDPIKLRQLIDSITTPNLDDLDLPNQLLAALDFETIETKYTRIVATPFYEPSPIKPKLQELSNADKVKELFDIIDKAELEDKDLVTFLKLAAARFQVINFDKCADYYANESDPKIKNLFERLALVIVDFDKSIEYGFLRFSKTIEKVLNDNE